MVVNFPLLKIIKNKLFMTSYFVYAIITLIPFFVIYLTIKAAVRGFNAKKSDKNLKKTII